MAGVDDLHELALEYLERCGDALAHTPGGTPARRFVSSGPPPWDCCPQLAVYVAGPDEAPTLPQGPLDQGYRLSKLASVNLITLVAQVIRCVPVVEGEGSVPPAADITAAAAYTNADVWALWNYLPAYHRAGTLFSPVGGEPRETYIDGVAAQVAQGGCSGWAFQVRTRLDGFGPAV